MSLHQSSIFRSCLIVLGVIGLAAVAAQPASATTLGQVLESIEGNPGHGAPCLRNTMEDALPSELRRDECAAKVVGVFYVSLMRDRERLQIVREAIDRQRALLAMIQERIESGIGSSGDSLLAEIELKHWQVVEAQLIGAVLHAELFFRSVLESEPSQMVRPRLAPSAWPEDDVSALAALAQQENLPEEEQRALQSLLQHAWIDYKAAQREFALLKPMSAFARDLADRSQKIHDVGQLSFAALLKRYRDATSLQDAEVRAEYRLLTIQLQVLEILGRRSAIE